MDIHDAAAKLMMRLVVKLALVSIILFTAIMLLFPTRTYADPNLRTLLLPPLDCGAPCFIGIKPGVTTINAAVQVLQASPLIQSIRITSFGRYNEQSIQAYLTLRLEQIQLLLDAQNGIVEGITLSNIDIPLGDVVLALGHPPQFVFNNALDRRSMTYAVFYRQYEMTVAVDLPICSLDVSRFWDVRRNISIATDAAQRFTIDKDYYLTGTHENGDGWAKQIDDMRGTSCA